MKKIILSLAVLVIVGASASAADFKTNPKAVEVFQTEFSGAQSVSWTEEDGFSKASFLIGGNRALAWFAKDGSLVGSVRSLLYNQLPLAVMRAMERKFGTADIYEIMEINNNEGTRYSFIIEKKGTKQTVTVSADGTIEDVKKGK